MHGEKAKGLLQVPTLWHSDRSNTVSRKASNGRMYSLVQKGRKHALCYKTFLILARYKNILMYYSPSYSALGPQSLGGKISFR